MEDKLRNNWETWKRWYERKFKKPYIGEQFLTAREKKDEVEWAKLEQEEIKKIKEWNGQESTDLMYEGAIIK